MPSSFLIAHAVLCALAFAGSAVVSWRSPRAAKLCAFLVLVLGGLQAWVFLHPRALAAPGWPEVFFFPELHAELACALLAAVPLAVEGRGAKARAVLLVLVLLGASAARMHQLYWPSPVSGVGFEEAGVVMQTQPGSCAAAAAATLLRALDIEPAATEGELAKLCFTDANRGTHDLGIFRGLSRAARERTVRFGERSLDELSSVGPCIAFVGLDRERAGAEFEPLRAQYNWKTGEYHAVVFFCLVPVPTPGARPHVLVGDPTFGLERWPLEHVVALWDRTTLEVSPASGRGEGPGTSRRRP